jgi:multidrug efflux pump subunit AcrB
MLKSIINRPIGVSMVFLAILSLGVIASVIIPVSLMPDIDVPKVTVQIEHEDYSAKVLETSIVGPLRTQLMQTSHLTDITSETRDGESVISLSFEYGTDISLASIEVNEKIDMSLHVFPKELHRPRVIKASSTDLPVYYLNLTLRDSTRSDGNGTDVETTDKDFIAMSDFVRHIIRRRLEQLPEVAMADISGTLEREIKIVPDENKLRSLGISIDELESVLQAANVNFGDLLIIDGQYQYNVRFSAELVDKKAIENVFIHVGNRTIQVKDCASVVESTRQVRGFVLFNSRPAISIAVIKQSDARMQDLSDKLKALVASFNSDYPQNEFSIARDQTKLLEYSISNLTQNLIWGAVLAFGVMFIFLKDWKSPLLIGISMPASLLISLIFFHLMGISINIISLSGLVLGLGMMIDNSIIVIDNIAQHRAMVKTIDDSCIDGTAEVFGPMLTSMFTNCAIFIPLIFLSGISGALFYDQAVAVVIGHLASLLVSVTLIPVYYRYLFDNKVQSFQFRIIDYERVYKSSFRWVMRNQLAVWVIIIGFSIAGIITYQRLPKSKLPEFPKEELVITLDWNERISVGENGRRVRDVIASLRPYLNQSTAYIGEQQFVLDRESQQTSSESSIFIILKNVNDVVKVKKIVDDLLKKKYPSGTVEFADTENVFNLIFPSDGPRLVAKLNPKQSVSTNDYPGLISAFSKIHYALREKNLDSVGWQNNLVVRADVVKMLTYNINPQSFYKQLSVALNESMVFLIKGDQGSIPVVIEARHKSLQQAFMECTIENSKGDRFPATALFSTSWDHDLKTITAGKEGEFIAVDLKCAEGEEVSVIRRVSQAMLNDPVFDLELDGSFFSNNAMIKDLTMILLICLALLYFILAAQFESLVIPIIVLLEVPIDIAGSVLLLKLFGSGINLMSLIGIVVMTGIVINDSLLKLDTVRVLRNEGHSLLKSLVIAGERRLQSILMTSLTAILAMAPMLFTSGFGVEIQKPLALALIGGMVPGTFVSLYFIPLCYYYIHKTKDKKVRFQSTNVLTGDNE